MRTVCCVCGTLALLALLTGSASGNTNRWLFHAIGDVGFWGATVSDGLEVAFVGITNNSDLYRWRASSGTHELIARRADIERHFATAVDARVDFAVRIAPNGDIYHAWLNATFNNGVAMAGWEVVTFRSQGTNRMVRTGRKSYSFSTVSENNSAGPLRVDANGRTALIYRDIPIGGPFFDYADLGDVVIQREPRFINSLDPGFLNALFLGDDGGSLVTYAYVDDNWDGWFTVYVNGAAYLNEEGYRYTFAMNPDGSVYEYLGVGHPQAGMTGHLNTDFGTGSTLVYGNGPCAPRYALHYQGAYPLKNGRFIAVCCASEDGNSAVVALRDGPDCVANRVIGVGDALFGSTVATLVPPAILSGGLEPRNTRGDFLFRVTLADGRALLVLAQRREGVVVDALEANQSIQDLFNSAPLIQGKRTTVRAYVRFEHPDPSVTTLRVAGLLHGTDTNGVPLPGSPLGMLNDGAGVIIRTSITSSTREDFERSLNFELPESWTRQPIKVSLEVPGLPFLYQRAENATLHFAETPDLPVRFVPVTMDVDGTAYAPPTASELGRDAWALQAAFPVAGVPWMVTPGIRFDGSSLQDERDLSLLLSHLTMLFVLDDKPPGPIYYGAFNHPRSFGGLAQSADNLKSVAAGQFYADSAPTFVHEVAHLMGRQHATSSNLFGYGACGSYTNDFGIRGACGECSPVSDHIDFPFFVTNTFGDYVAATGPNDSPNILQHAFALDHFSATPNVLNPDETTELMSYCAININYLKPWPSLYTYHRLWSALYARFPDGAPALQRRTFSGGGSSYFIARGTIDVRDDTVVFAPFARGTRAHAIAAPTSGVYTLELRDGLDGLLASYDFSPDDGSESTLAVQPFTLVLPDHPDIRTVVVRKGPTEIARRTASDQTPTVTVLTPNGGEHHAGSSVPLSWSATDPDGGPLSFNIFFSADGGASWTPVAIDVAGTDYDLPRTYVPGTTNALIRVMASDGFWTASDQSDAPFSTANHAPVLTLRLGSPGQVIVQGSTPRLEVEAYDVEDGLLSGESLLWISDVQGTVATGTTLQAELAGFDPGLHQLSVFATDRNGNVTTAELPVNIQPHEAAVISELALLSNQLQVVAGEADQPVALVLEQSSNLVNWVPVSTTLFTDVTFALTNPVTPAPSVFFRVASDLHPPVITRQPGGGGLYYFGETLLRSVQATGSPPLYYQWHRNGQPLAVPSAPDLLLEDLQADGTGTYWVVVSNRAGAVASSTFTIEIGPEPLRFVSLPEAIITATPGQTLELCCMEALGTPPIHYQWRLGGAPIPGATSSNLLLAGLTTEDFGFYDVIASNAYQTITSRVTEVRNESGPQFINEPDSGVVQGAGADLIICCAEVSGAEPIFFQWWKDGGEVGGATNIVYEKSPATLDDAGFYYLVASNAVGAATSIVCQVEIYSD